MGQTIKASRAQSAVKPAVKSTSDTAVNIVAVNQNSERKNFGTLTREALAIKLATEVVAALHEQDEALDVFQSDFRHSLTIIWDRLLRKIEAGKQAVQIFAEAIPGFTLMVLRSDEVADKALPTSIDLSRAIDPLLNKFSQYAGHSVITIDWPGTILLLFPVRDLAANLEMLEVFVRDHA